MAKVKLNPILEQVRGQVGDLVFKRYGDEVVISRKPERPETPPTERQLETRERFRHATVYGRIAMADPESKALYESAAHEKGVPLFSLAVADFFNAPSVSEIDLSGYGGKAGDRIVILAHDDFQVTGVTVMLADGAGNELESGAAVETPARSGRYQYSATTDVTPGTAVSVRVTVTDRPGTEVRVEEGKRV